MNNIADDLYNAYSDGLRDGAPKWIKTADRLPTEADAGVDEEIVTIFDDGKLRVMGADYWAFVAKFPELFQYWLPVPKLPGAIGRSRGRMIERRPQR